MPGRINEETLSSIQKIVATQVELLNQTFGKIRLVIQDQIKELLKIPDSNKFLAENGWYLPFDFNPPEVNFIVMELRKGNVEFVDNEMIEYIDSTINRIESRLINNFPNRKAVIRAAIRAHKDQEYYLSIPVFLAQIEGICVELTGSRFFSSINKVPLTEAWANNFSSDSIIGMLLEPLKLKGAVRQGESNEQPIGFNRHEILHGVCNDYGENKVNSYKVLSLLNYIGETVYEAKKEIG